MAPDETLGDTEPGGSSQTLRTLLLGQIYQGRWDSGLVLGPSRYVLRDKVPFPVFFLCVLNSKAISQMIRKGHFGIF